MNISRPKILHVIGALIAGGAEKFTLDLAGSQRKIGLDPMIYALSNRRDSKGEQLRETAQKNAIKLFAGPNKSVNIQTILSFNNTLKQLSPDLVHLHTPNTELCFALATFCAKPYRVTRTIHSSRAPNRKRFRWALARNKTPISISCGPNYGSYSGLVENEIEFIPNGVDFNWPIPDKDSKLRIRDRLGIEIKQTHFLSIGSMYGRTVEAAQKAHDVLIKAWLQSNITNAKLHLIGDGPLKGELENLAVNSDSILFHGIRSDVSDWMQAVDCFVMPSRWEGLPIAGIEAIGSGLPVIFSKIKELENLEPPVVQYVKKNDISGLAIAFQNQATQDKKSKISLTDYQAFRERFSIDVAANRYLDVYRRLLE